jgi:hypothetical protein
MEKESLCNQSSLTQNKKPFMRHHRHNSKLYHKNGKRKQNTWFACNPSQHVSEWTSYQSPLKTKMKTLAQQRIAEYFPQETTITNMEETATVATNQNASNTTTTTPTTPTIMITPSPPHVMKTKKRVPCFIVHPTSMTMVVNPSSLLLPQEEEGQAEINNSHKEEMKLGLSSVESNKISLDSFTSHDEIISSNRISRKTLHQHVINRFIANMKYYFECVCQDTYTKTSPLKTSEKSVFQKKRRFHYIQEKIKEQCRHKYCHKCLRSLQVLKKGNQNYRYPPSSLNEQQQLAIGTVAATPETNTAHHQPPPPQSLLFTRCRRFRDRRLGKPSRYAQAKPIPPKPCFITSIPQKNTK